MNLEVKPLKSPSHSNAIVLRSPNRRLSEVSSLRRSKQTSLDLHPLKSEEEDHEKTGTPPPPRNRNASLDSRIAGDTFTIIKEPSSLADSLKNAGRKMFSHFNKGDATVSQASIRKFDSDPMLQTFNSKYDKSFMKRLRSLIKNSDEMYVNSDSTKKMRLIEGIEDLYRMHLMSQYLTLQHDINTYIQIQYSPNPVPALLDPHDLYRPKLAKKEPSESSFNLDSLKLFTSPDSKYVADLRKDRAEFRKSEYDPSTQSFYDKNPKKIGLETGEKVMFTPDSCHFLIYSAYSIKMIDVNNGRVVFEEKLSILQNYAKEAFDLDLQDEEFNQKMCFGGFLYELNDVTTHYKFVFWSPLFVFTFHYYPRQNLYEKPLYIQLYIVKKLPVLMQELLQKWTRDSKKPQVSFCSGGGHVLYMLTEVDRKTAAYRCTFELTSLTHNINFTLMSQQSDDSSPRLGGDASPPHRGIVKVAIYEIAEAPVLFDLSYNDIHLSQGCSEKGFGLDEQECTTYRKLFVDTRTSKLCQIWYRNNGVFVEHYFSLDSEVKFVKLFGNPKFFGIVWKDQYVTFYMHQQGRFYVVMRSFIERCMSLATSSDGSTLYILTESTFDDMDMQMKLQAVPICLPHLPEPTLIMESQFCAETTKTENLYSDENGFLCLQIVQEVPKLFVYKYDSENAEVIDPREHEIYKPKKSHNVISLPTIKDDNRHSALDVAASPNIPETITTHPTPAGIFVTNKRAHYTVIIDHYIVKKAGIVFYMTITDRDTRRAGKLVKAIQFNTLAQYVILDTLGEDKSCCDFKHCHVDENLLTVYIILDSTWLSRKVSASWTPLISSSPFVEPDRTMIPLTSVIFTTMEDRLKSRDKHVVRGDFFDCIHNEIVDVHFDLDEHATKITILNNQFKVVCFSSFRKEIGLKRVASCPIETLYALWGPEGMVLVDRCKQTFNWLPAANFTKVVDTENELTKVEISSNSKYLIASLRTSKKTNLFFCFETDNFKKQEMLSCVMSNDLSEGTEWCITEDSVYWMYATGQNKTVFAYNLCLRKEMHSIDMSCPMNVKFMRINNHTIDLVGFLIPRNEDAQPSTHTYFRIQQSLQPKNNSLLPLIQHQMVQHFTTDSTDRRQDCMNTIEALLEALQSHMVGMNPIYMIIMFMMNHSESFQHFSHRHMPLEHMLENHKLMRLFFSTNKGESTRAIVEMLNNFVDIHQEYPCLEEEYIYKLIMDGGKFFLKNPASKSMMRRLLFSYVSDTPPIELKHEDSAVTHLRTYGDNVLKSNMIADTYSFLIEDEPRDPEIHQIYETKIKLDLELGSEFSMAFFAMVSNTSDKDLAERYTYFINYKWNRIYIFALVYCLLYWTMTILYYFYFGFSMSNTSIAPALTVISAIFLAFEIKCCVSGLRTHLKDPWNIFDICIFIGSITLNSWLRFRGTGHEENEQIATTWCRAIVGLALCIRSLMHLRVFKATRYIISMILRVFYDLLPFLVILCWLIFMFAFIWKISPKLNTPQGARDDERPELTFYGSLQTPFAIIFGNSPTEDEEGKGFNSVRFVILIIGNLVLGITMMNFLIGIITSTYEIISEMRDVYNAKELLGFIRDWDAFFYRIMPRQNAPKFYITVIKMTDKDEEFIRGIKAEAERKLEIQALRHEFEMIVQQQLEVALEKQRLVLNKGIQTLQMEIRTVAAHEGHPFEEEAKIKVSTASSRPHTPSRSLIGAHHQVHPQNSLRRTSQDQFAEGFSRYAKDYDINQGAIIRTREKKLSINPIGLEKPISKMI